MATISTNRPAAVNCGVNPMLKPTVPTAEKDSRAPPKMFLARMSKGRNAAPNTKDKEMAKSLALAPRSRRDLPQVDHTLRLPWMMLTRIHHHGRESGGLDAARWNRKAPMNINIITKSTRRPQLVCHHRVKPQERGAADWKKAASSFCGHGRGPMCRDYCTPAAGLSTCPAPAKGPSRNTNQECTAKCQCLCVRQR